MSYERIDDTFPILIIIVVCAQFSSDDENCARRYSAGVGVVCVLVCICCASIFHLCTSVCFCLCKCICMRVARRALRCAVFNQMATVRRDTRLLLQSKRLVRKPTPPPPLQPVVQPFSRYAQTNTHVSFARPLSVYSTKRRVCQGPTRTRAHVECTSCMSDHAYINALCCAADSFVARAPQATTARRSTLHHRQQQHHLCHLRHHYQRPLNVNCGAQRHPQQQHYTMCIAWLRGGRVFVRVMCCMMTRLHCGWWRKEEDVSDAPEHSLYTTSMA